MEMYLFNKTPNSTAELQKHHLCVPSTTFQVLVLTISEKPS